MGKILVTGGAGFIGSHTIVDLINNRFEVISADNFINSTAAAFDGIEAITGKKIKNYEIDLSELQPTLQIFEENPDIKGVIHFAALKSVGESVNKPLAYFKNNLNSLLNIIEGMKQYQVPNLIFSSSCSVYGNSTELPVKESTPRQEAESPYARTKQMGEDICEDIAQINKDLQFVLLRYFNPAGAHPSGLLGESPSNKAENLVPVITETAIGKRKKMMVFGDDYPTRDGSCVRDYIYIMDLANAHTKSLQYLMNQHHSKNLHLFNVGVGDGTTVLEAIQAFEKVSGQKLNYEIGPRRPGDVVAVWADTQKAKQALNWNPQSNIEDIMRTAWQWEQVRSQ